MIALKVGQELYQPASCYGHEGVRVVEKIGRVWVHLTSAQRLLIGSLRVDGSYGLVLYSSKSEYLASKALDNAWSELRRDIGYRAYAGVTLETIAAARELLMLDEVAP